MLDDGSSSRAMASLGEPSEDEVIADQSCVGLLLLDACDLFSFYL